MYTYTYINMQIHTYDAYINICICIDSPPKWTHWLLREGNFRPWVESLAHKQQIKT